MSAATSMVGPSTLRTVADVVREVRWLLVHDMHDAAGAWLGQQWHGSLPVNQRQHLLVLPTPAITLHTRTHLRIAEGRTQSLLRVGLPGQQECTISSDSLRGVLWRAPGPWVKGDPVTDREAAYALQERQALLLAWLHGLGKACATRPRADGLAGPRWSGAKWRALATACGLPVVQPSRYSVDMEPGLVVVGTTVVPLLTASASPLLVEAARRLAAKEGCAHLLLYGSESSGRWSFVQADPCPDLRIAAAHTKRLVDALGQRLGMKTSRQALSAG